MKRRVLGLTLVAAFGTLLGALAVHESRWPGFVSGRADHLALEQLPGSTRTLFADGKLLVIGGESDRDVADRAAILSSKEEPAQTLPLQFPRHLQSATAMPDGRILIWGGVDARGHVVATGEWFDPETRRLTPAAQLPITPRAGHTATVLTDGRMLLAGGWTEQGPSAKAELFDPANGKVKIVDAPVGIGRAAELTADGRVVFQGGFDASGQRLSDGAVFDPHSSEFERVPLNKLLASSRAPVTPGAQVVESFPAAGTKSAAIVGPLALRFSAPMELGTLNPQTLTLLGPQGIIDVTVHSAEQGRLAFISPKVELLPGAFYALYVKGAKSTDGEKVPVAVIDFDTATLGIDSNTSRKPSTSLSSLSPPLNALTASATLIEDDKLKKYWNKKRMKAVPKVGYIADGAWHPGKDGMNGHWRINRPFPELPKFEDLGKKLPDHTTALYGQILQVDDQPIAEVEVTIGATSTRTDRLGRFLLINPSAGRQEMFVDGSTAGRGNFEYGQLVMGVDVQVGKISSLSQQVFLPKINPTDRVAIESPTTRDITLTHPELPGVEVHIPAGTVFRDHKGRILKDIALVPTPLDRAPYPVPTNFPVYFTLQPGGAAVLGMTPEAAKGIRVIYPNYTHAPAGTEMSFWVYDPTLGWKTYGKGQVSRDGQQVVPDSGVALYEEVGAGYNLGGGAGGNGPGGCSGGPPPGGGGGDGDGGGGGGGSYCAFGGGAAASGADPVDLATGRFDESWNDSSIDDIIPIVLTRHYHQGNPQSYAFGIGMSWDYGIQLVATDATDNQLQVLMPNGLGIPFTRISGSGPTGAWKNITGATKFFGAVLTTGGSTPESYILTLTDGTTYTFWPVGPNVLTSVRDRFGNTVTLTYSGQNVASITSPSGRYLRISWDGSNRITQIVDHVGRTTHYNYNPSGTLKSVVYPDGTSEQYTYDPATNSMLTKQDRRGNIVFTNSYDSYGRLSQQVLADGATYNVVYTMDGGSKITATDLTDPVGIVRHVTFDAAGYPLTDTYGYGQADAQTYTFQRDPVTEFISQRTDPLGRTTLYARDAIGNVLHKVDLAGTPEAITTSYTYTSDFHDLASVTDPLNHTTTYSYTAGCLTQVQDALGHTTSIVCNGAGQVVSRTDALGHTTQYGYDGYDIARITDPLSRTLSLYRDALGRITSIVDPLGNVRIAAYDSNDRVLSIANPLSFTTQYAYDNNGNLTSVVDPANGIIGYVYDTRNRRVGESDALLHSQSWTYDGLARPLTHTDRNAQQASASYDDLGRVASIIDADGGQSQYTYDAGNRLASVSDSISGTISLGYDLLDRLVQEQTSQGQIGYGYDAANRRISVQVVGQPAVSYTYDAANRLNRISNGSEAVTFDYDAANRRTSIILPNGVQTVYTYDDASQLTGLSYFKPDNSVLGNLIYVYDNVGHRTSQSGTWAFDQLPAASTSDYQYNAGNRLTSGNAFAPTYDNEGQMTADGRGQIYVWNARHQLQQILQGSVTVASFQYDAFGRRIQKTVNGNTTGYLYDGYNALQEQQGSALFNIMAGKGINERYARDDVPGRSYYLKDALGSTIALTDTDGDVQQQYAYEPYGHYTANGLAGLTNPYAYTGQEDDGTGLYYYRARYYSPQIARFISEDPLGLGGGPNVYAYVGQNPASFVDPLGLKECQVNTAYAYLQSMFPNFDFPPIVYDPTLGRYGEYRDFWQGDLNPVIALPSSDQTADLGPDQFNELVNTLYHELLHANDSIYGGFATTLGDTYFSGPPYGLGPHHTGIWNQADQFTNSNAVGIMGAFDNCNCQ